MDGGEKTLGNKALVGVLAFLCVTIMGLIVGIVVVNLNQDNNDNKEESSDSQAVEMSESEIAYNEYVKNYYDVNTKAVALLNEVPPNLDAVVTLYQDYINKYLSKNDLSRAESFVYAENNILIEAGFKEEALEVMADMDYSAYRGSTQYIFYDKIIAQAKDLGRNDIVAKYEPLLASVKDAYDANYDWSMEKIKEFDTMEAQEE